MHQIAPSCAFVFLSAFSDSPQFFAGSSGGRVVSVCRCAQGAEMVPCKCDWLDDVYDGATGSAGSDDKGTDKPGSSLQYLEERSTASYKSCCVVSSTSQPMGIDTFSDWRLAAAAIAQGCAACTKGGSQVLPPPQHPLPPLCALSLLDGAGTQRLFCSLAFFSPRVPFVLTGEKFDAADGSAGGIVEDFMSYVRQLLYKSAERAAAAAAALHLSRLDMQRRFICSMSHELRTPLSAIVAYSSLTLQDCEASPEAVGNSLEVLRSARTLLALIEGMLEACPCPPNSSSIAPSTHWASAHRKTRN